MLEEFLLKKRKIAFEAWQALLVVIVIFVGFMGFIALVEHGASDQNRSGPLAKVAVQIARIPVTIKPIIGSLFDPKAVHSARYNRFDEDRGFLFAADAENDGDVLVLSRYDPDSARTVVELIDLSNGEVFHRYAPDIKKLNALSKLKPPVLNLARDHTPNRYVMFHPLLSPDGGLIFHSEASPIAKVDACSNIEWATDGLFHHATEFDADGNIWSAVAIKPAGVRFAGQDFIDDGIAQIAPNGEIVFQKSVANLLIENGLAHLVYTAEKYRPDPIHLNDIQPALNDGAHWKKGDVFLSLRNQSAIVQYRPSTNKVIWHKQGPWLGQHDVDIVSEHEISIYNNNRAVTPHGENTTEDNEVQIYDFATDTVSSPYREAFKINKINTITAGLNRILPDGSVFVEEQNYGRLLVMDDTGDVKWRYINRGANGNLYRVQWSTYLTRNEAAAARAAIIAKECKGA